VKVALVERVSKIIVPTLAPFLAHIEVGQCRGPGGPDVHCHRT
jgi:hypothetical protein